MDEPKYERDYDYDEYEDYRRRGVTGVGLPPGQLALIIGVNAVISLIISVGVVLLVGRAGGTGDITAGQAAVAGTAVVNAGMVTTSTVTTPSSGITQTVSEASAPSRPATYVVQPGDTLSVIAEKFTVPMADLMSANGLTNQDFIQVGQELKIPEVDLSTPTATFTPEPIPTDTPLPFDPPTPIPSGVDIPQEPAATVGPTPIPTATPTQVISTSIILPTFTPAPFNDLNVSITDVIGAGDLAQETMIILNQGAGVSLKDWKLEGSPLGVITFPDIFLFSGGSIRIHSLAGVNTPTDLYLNQGESAWPPGTTIILSNASNAEIARFKVPGSSTTP